jgi:hypothetical protein
MQFDKYLEEGLKIGYKNLLFSLYHHIIKNSFLEKERLQSIMNFQHYFLYCKMFSFWCLVLALEI